LLTATKWDHVNIYPTEQSYIDAFKKLADKTLENNGLMLFAANGENNQSSKNISRAGVGKHLFTD